MMDTSELAAFLAIADAGSFSAAAARLHLSQPAISKRIASLEAAMDRRLFDRIGRAVHLTEAGRALLPHAREALRKLDDGRRALAELSGQVEGRLAVGTSHHIGLHRLPPVLKRYVGRYPAVELDLHFMDSEVACRDVLAGRLELGIVTLPLEPLPGLEVQPVWDDPLAVVVGAGHPLAGRARVPLAALADYPAVLPDAATYTHRIVTAELARHGVAPKVRLATNYLETLKMLAAIGLGWSVLPRSMIDRGLRALVTPGFGPARTLGAVWHRQRSLSSPAQSLLKELPRYTKGA